MHDIRQYRQVFVGRGALSASWERPKLAGKARRSQAPKRPTSTPVQVLRCGRLRRLSQLLRQPKSRLHHIESQQPAVARVSLAFQFLDSASQRSHGPDLNLWKVLTAGKATENLRFVHSTSLGPVSLRGQLPFRAVVSRSGSRITPARPSRSLALSERVEKLPRGRPVTLESNRKG